MLRIMYPLCIVTAMAFVSCNQGHEPVCIRSQVKIHSLNNAKHYQLETLNRALPCGCSPIYDIFPWTPELYYWKQASGKDSIEFENEFKAYAHDSIRSSVKGISFSGCSTIPSRFGIFKNVEKIEFNGVHGDANLHVKLKGLEMFPKLKRLEFFGCIVNIDSNDHWIQQIEQLEMYKCQVNDFPSFDHWHNLKLLYIGYSGFDPLPKNINSLHCLQKIMINEYHSQKSGPLNLHHLDFRYLPCLRFASFKGGTTGIPKRLKSGRQYRLEMRKWGLTPEEKETIDPYIQHFN